MKNKVLLLLFLLFGALAAKAQLSDQQRQERSYYRSLTNEQRYKFAQKKAKPEVKRLKEQGWYAESWTPNLDLQLAHIFDMQMEYEDSLFPEHILAEAKFTAPDRISARREALRQARKNIAAPLRKELQLLYPSATPEDVELLLIQAYQKATIELELYREQSGESVEAWIFVGWDTNLVHSTFGSK